MMSHLISFRSLLFVSGKLQCFHDHGQCILFINESCWSAVGFWLHSTTFVIHCSCGYMVCSYFFMVLQLDQEQSCTYYQLCYLSCSKLSNFTQWYHCSLSSNLCMRALVSFTGDLMLETATLVLLLSCSMASSTS